MNHWFRSKPLIFSLSQDNVLRQMFKVKKCHITIFINLIKLYQIGLRKFDCNAQRVPKN